GASTGLAAASGGSAMRGLEAAGRPSTVGSQATAVSPETLPVGKEGRISWSAPARGSAPGSKGETSAGADLALRPRRLPPGAGVPAGASPQRSSWPFSAAACRTSIALSSSVNFGSRIHPQPGEVCLDPLVPFRPGVGPFQGGDVDQILLVLVL